MKKRGRREKQMMGMMEVRFINNRPLEV